VLGANVALYRIKGGYSLAKIQSSLPPFLLWTPRGQDALFAQVSPLLDQPFYFLSSGGTSFAFLGKDGKTILKLFKHQHLTPKSWLFYTCLPGISDALRIYKILEREKKHHHKRVPFFFTSCAIAYEELREETGILFLTLHRDPRCDKTVTLIDRLGFSLKLHLQDTEFAVQQRATPLFEHLLPLIHTGRMEEAKEAISSLISLLSTRCRKGIADRDPHLGLNFGFIGNRAMEYDIGSYFWDPDLSQASHVKKELFFATFELRQWLEKHSPELLEYLHGILLPN